MKKILVPTDFSDCAHNAAETAIEIAKRYGAELHFFHFMSIPIDWIHLEDTQARLYPDVTKEVRVVKSQLQDLVNNAEKQGLETKYYLEFDNSSDSITRYAIDQEVSMIVMGSHGAKGIKEFFIGSNAQRVVRNSKIPVLIIKDKMDTVKIPNILFVSDFEEEMIKPFENVVAFAELLGAKIHLLYINTPSEFQRSWEIHERMESFVAIAGKNLEKAEIIDSFYFEEGLEKFCEINHTGLLAIATHHRRGLSRAFMGSLTEQVVNHVKVPVVSFPV